MAKECTCCGTTFANPEYDYCPYCGEDLLDSADIDDEDEEEDEEETQA